MATMRDRMFKPCEQCGIEMHIKRVACKACGWKRGEPVNKLVKMAAESGIVDPNKVKQAVENQERADSAARARTA